jgi:hypothetical protein
MFPWSPGEFKTRSVILEARALRIRYQNLNPTISTKNNFLLHIWYSMYEIKPDQPAPAAVGARFAKSNPLFVVLLSCK